jgi:hypothetical protein
MGEWVCSLQGGLQKAKDLKSEKIPQLFGVTCTKSNVIAKQSIN